MSSIRVVQLRLQHVVLIPQLVHFRKHSIILFLDSLKLFVASTLKPLRACCERLHLLDKLCLLLKRQKCFGLQVIYGLHHGFYLFFLFHLSLFVHLLLLKCMLAFALHLVKLLLSHSKPVFQAPYLWLVVPILLLEHLVFQILFHQTLLNDLKFSWLALDIADVVGVLSLSLAKLELELGDLLPHLRIVVLQQFCLKLHLLKVHLRFISLLSGLLVLVLKHLD